MGIMTVDPARCLKCGICAEICSAGIIRMGKDKPEVILEKACMACGHCTAICPHDALDNTKALLANQVSISETTNFDEVSIAYFLRSRRSVRCYRPEAVGREKLRRLLEIARFAPSGSNAQGVSYIVVEDREVLRKVVAVTVEWLDEQISKDKDTQEYLGYTDEPKETSSYGTPRI